MTRQLPQFSVSGSHHEVGYAIGRRFADQINGWYDNQDRLQEALRSIDGTAAGKALFDRLVALNRARYPHLLDELEGMAEGAGRPPAEILLMNLREEYQTILTGRTDEGCTDLLRLDDAAALIAHNEDGAPDLDGSLYLVHVQITGKPSFTALTYPGFLPGNAFGFNSAGVCFSVNYVAPRSMHAGVGRYWVARSMLEATSLEDAIRRATVRGRASGFSYNIGSVPERRIVVLEVAPDTYHVHPVRGVYAHTNHYRHLPEVEQVISPSSEARLRRAEEGIASHDAPRAAGLLALLGDASDPSYPIYRDATPPDRSKTLCTALYDLDARTLGITLGRPADGERIELTL